MPEPKKRWSEPRNAAERKLLRQLGEGDEGMEALSRMRGTHVAPDGTEVPNGSAADDEEEERVRRRQRRLGAK